MEYINIGKIVNTHGTKGEIRILSYFKYKTLVLNKAFINYIGDNKELLLINSYSSHKNYDMITLEGINNINDVLKYKGQYVYINKEDLSLTDNMYLDTDLIDCKVYDNGQYVGIITDIMKAPLYNILVIMNNNKKILVPNIDQFIKHIDLKQKKVTINSIKGLIV